MTRGSLYLILLSITITAFAQILLKAGMTSATVERAMTNFGLRAATVVMLNPLVLGGMVLYFGASIVWLVVLSRVQVSLAYPFVALGFVLTTALSRILFNEPISTARIVAILLICGGVILLARS